MLDEHDIERYFEQLSRVEPSADSARRAVERAQQIIEQQVDLNTQGNRRLVMLARIAAVILVLVVVSGALGGAIWYVASNNDGQGLDNKPPSEIVRPEQPKQPVSQPETPKSDVEPESQPDKSPKSDEDNSPDAGRPEAEPPKPPAKPLPVDPPTIVKPDKVNPQKPTPTPDDTDTRIVNDARQPKVDMGWATVSGTFVYDGDIPERARIAVSKDGAFCGKHELFDESLVINPANRGIKNVIVYLYLKSTDPAPTIHPDYEKLLEQKVVLDNNRCRFEPHVSLLRTTQTLVVTNTDGIAHNSKIDMLANPPINPLVPAGAKLEHVYGVRERLPCPVSCSIHPWMTGWLVLMDHPYMAVTDENGFFQIANLPPGERTLQFWHEKQGYIQAVTLDGSEETWKFGRVTKTMSAGHFDFGTIQTHIGRDK